MRYGVLIIAAVVAACSVQTSAQGAESVPDLASVDRSEADRALDASRRPADVLDFAGIKRGDIVADYYAGQGYYTALIAQLVGPKGKVYALNPPSFIDGEAWGVLLGKNSNVMALTAPADSLHLAPGSVDVIFSHLVYHDLYWQSDKYNLPALDVSGVASNWFAALKPGGHVVIIDHWGPSGDPRVIVDRLHRIDPAIVKADMAEAGFVLEAESKMLQRSEDDQKKNVFDPAVRGRTSRFILKFRRK